MMSTGVLEKWFHACGRPGVLDATEERGVLILLVSQEIRRAGAKDDADAQAIARAGQQIRRPRSPLSPPRRRSDRFVTSAGARAASTALSTDAIGTSAATRLR